MEQTRARTVQAALAFMLVIGLMTLGGCGQAEQAASDTAMTESTIAATEEAPPQDENWSLTLGFTGDICLADNYIPMQHLAELNSTDITDGIDRRFVAIMRSEDLMWVNNEFVYSDRGEPLLGKEWTFRGATANVRYLDDLGVDIVGLANNHVFDYGENSFLDTLDTLADAGVPYVGAGRNFAEASSPVYLESNGVKVAYVAASCAEYTIYTPEAGEDSPGIMWCYDDEKFLAEIAEAAANADYVVALPHWGVEHSTQLEEKQINSARAYIDAGADAVVACHTHILQGIDFYEGKPILYSLGNFWFDDYDIDTAFAELTLEGQRSSDGSIDANAAQVSLRLYPGRQSGAFTEYEGEDPVEKERIFRYIEEISDGNISIDAQGYVHPSA